MKKLVLFGALFMFIQAAFAGGLLTNTNQSAQFVRMLSRNASLDIDAVYFNPAGLIKLEDGWHFAFYSQTIFQDKTVDSKFPLLNDGHYVGEVIIPVFPTTYAVYRKDNWAFSFGFSPNAGGGTADFDRGLPSFEIPISKAVPALSGLTQIDPSLNVTGYNADLSFKGSSVFWGIQLGATYKVSDRFSVYGGVRYMPSKNTYKGSIKHVQLEVAGQMFGAPEWLNQTAGTVSGLASMAGAAATQLGGTASGLQPLIDGGAGAYTLAQLENANYIDATTRTALENGLSSLGVAQTQIDQMSLSTVQGTYSSAANTYSTQSAQLSGTAGALEESAGNLGDREVDTKQTGAGITPIIGINIYPNDDWNISLKYEHKTRITLENDTKVDEMGLFPDGGKTASDVPGILGLGIGYRGLSWLEAQFSYTVYLNKGVDWGYNTRDMAIWKDVDPTKIHHREMDKNGVEFGLGLQFNLSDDFALSVGGLYGDMGFADSYQSDFSYSNPSKTVGAGIMWKITEKLVLDAGVSHTYYKDQTVTFQDPDFSDYAETLGKTTLDLAVGLSYSIF